MNEISEKMVASTFFKCIQNMIFNAIFAKRHPLFSASFFFLFDVLYMDAHYTRVNTVFLQLISVAHVNFGFLVCMSEQIKSSSTKGV